MTTVHTIIVSQNTSMKDTMRVIDRGSLRTALVTDAQGKLVGIVTDGDVRRAILKGFETSEPVSTIMNRQPQVIHATATKSEISAIFLKHDVLGIPVVDTNGVLIDYLPRTALATTGAKPHTPHPAHISHVLVIGGAGYIGSLLVRKLLAKHYKVTVLDRFLYGEEPLADIKNDPNLTILHGDTRHIEDITTALNGVDAAVHLAELVGDPACAYKPATTLEINYLATRLIAEICKYHQVNRFIYISSCSVYGQSNGDEFLTETSPLNPVSLYAKMKIQSEQALLGLQDENFSPTILRLGTVFGYSHRPRFDLVVNTLTANAVRDKKITVFGGKQWRPNVHVGDVGNTIIAALEAPLDVVAGEVFNVGSSENNHTIEDLGVFVGEAVPSAEAIIDDRSVDKRDYKVDFTKLKTKLAVPPWKSVPEGIAEVRDALLAHPAMDPKQSKYSNIAYLRYVDEKSDE